jgi:hypothetical protein
MFRVCLDHRVRPIRHDAVPVQVYLSAAKHLLPSHIAMGRPRPACGPGESVDLKGLSSNACRESSHHISVSTDGAATLYSMLRVDQRELYRLYCDAHRPVSAKTQAIGPWSKFVIGRLLNTFSTQRRHLLANPTSSHRCTEHGVRERTGYQAILSWAFAIGPLGDLQHEKSQGHQPLGVAALL